MRVFGYSDVGVARPNNEDAWISIEEIRFYALADGMGGHQAGEVAAKEAIEDLCLSIRRLHDAPPMPLPELVLAFRHAIEKANRWVYEMSQDAETLSGMGTTLCCLYWTPQAILYAHVGDSRIYRFRKGLCEQMTQDHSLFAQWLAMGQIAEESETPYPYKNVITRAIGTSRRANPEVAVATYEPGDLYLLCSDGLSDRIVVEEMEKILENGESLERAAHLLIERAKIKGSSDNITVLLIQCPQQ
jgi:serine/threonine protein phosphatase PrpC